MNLIILCDKNIQKFISKKLEFKENNYGVLSYENELRTDFARRVSDFLPHIVVVFRGYRNRGADLIKEILKVREDFPDIRFVYIYGKITDEQDFLQTTTALIENGVFDISISEPYGQGFKKDFYDLLKTPMNLEDFKTLLQKRAENNKYFEVSDTLQSELIRVVDKTQVNFSKTTVESGFSDENTTQLDELQEHRNSEHFVIAVSALYQSIGIDTIALEIAVMLAQAKQSVSLFLPDSLYYPYMDYHGIEKEAAQHGCVVNDLPIYPLELFDSNIPKAKFNITVIFDISDKIFEKAEIKIAMCSATECNIKELENYLNLPLPYIKEINYCFYPISQENFKNYNGAMVQGHCKAFRLCTSSNYTNPCEWNKKVYHDILNLYTEVDTKKKMKLFGR